VQAKLQLAAAVRDALGACDGSASCRADMHRRTCLGLYRTDTEVAADVIPTRDVLEERREREATLRAVARADQNRYPQET
jgi:hypothetical protein